MNKLLTKKNILITAVLLVVLAFFIKSTSISRTIADPALSYSIAILVGSILVALSRSVLLRSWLILVACLVPPTIYFIWVNKMGGMFSPGSKGAAIISGEVLIVMTSALIAMETWELRCRNTGKPVSRWTKFGLLIPALILSVGICVFTYGLIW